MFTHISTMCKKHPFWYEQASHSQGDLNYLQLVFLPEYKDKEDFNQWNQFQTLISLLVLFEANLIFGKQFSVLV